MISSIFRERFFLFFWVLLLHGGDRGNLSSYIKIISAWVPFWRARVLGVLLLGLVWLRFDLETCWICVCRAIDYFLSRVDLDFLVGSCWLTRNSGTFWVFSIFLSIFSVFYGSWGCFSSVAVTRTTLRNRVRWGRIGLLMGGLNWWRTFLFAGERRWRFCCVWWWLLRFWVRWRRKVCFWSSHWLWGVWVIRQLYRKKYWVDFKDRIGRELL